MGSVRLVIIQLAPSAASAGTAKIKTFAFASASKAPGRAAGDDPDQCGVRWGHQSEAFGAAAAQPDPKPTTDRQSQDRDLFDRRRRRGQRRCRGGPSQAGRMRQKLAARQAFDGSAVIVDRPPSDALVGVPHIFDTKSCGDPRCKRGERRRRPGDDERSRPRKSEQTRRAADQRRQFDHRGKQHDGADGANIQCGPLFINPRRGSEGPKLREEKQAAIATIRPAPAFQRSIAIPAAATSGGTGIDDPAGGDGRDRGPGGQERHPEGAAQVGLGAGDDSAR